MNWLIFIDGSIKLAELKERSKRIELTESSSAKRVGEADRQTDRARPKLELTARKKYASNLVLLVRP